MFEYLDEIANLVFGPFRAQVNAGLYVNWGSGLHSNDARGATSLTHSTAASIMGEFPQFPVMNDYQQLRTAIFNASERIRDDFCIREEKSCQKYRCLAIVRLPAERCCKPQ